MSRKKANLCPQVLTGNCWKPSPVALGVLRHLEYTEPVVIHKLEKPEWAYTVAEWYEPLFNCDLFSDYIRKNVRWSS
jgi:hypothetical protein